MSQAEKLAQLQERVQALEGVRAGWLSDATAYPTRHFVRGEHATCPERIEALATALADERQKVLLLQAEYSVLQANFDALAAKHIGTLDGAAASLPERNQG